MEMYDIDNLAGIYEDDGSVKCVDCMKDKDWENLKQENIITGDDIARNDEFIYCDYCEKKL